MVICYYLYGKEVRQRIPYNIFPRREWDSNPRYGYPHTNFPGLLLKPLGHLSVFFKKGSKDRILCSTRKKIKKLFRTLRKSPVKESEKIILPSLPVQCLHGILQPSVQEY